MNIRKTYFPQSSNKLKRKREIWPRSQPSQTGDKTWFFSSEFWLEKNCVRVLMFGWSLTSQTISFSGTIYITQLIYPDWGLTKSTVTFWLKTLRLPLVATPLLLWRSLRMLIMWWSFQLNQKTTKWIKSCRVPSRFGPEGLISPTPT